MKNFTKKTLGLLAAMLTVCSLGFAQPPSTIDANKNLIITKSMQQVHNGTPHTITFRRVLCENPAQALETINIVAEDFPKIDGKRLELKIKVRGEVFALEPHPTVYSSAEAETAPVKGYSFLVSKSVQRMLQYHRETVSLVYGLEGNMVTYVPTNEEKEDLGFMHVCSYENAGIKK